MAHRKHFEEEHENHERWLISYADFITLLFAFFVVMYSISSVDKKKYDTLSYALGNAFNKNGDLMMSNKSRFGAVSDNSSSTSTGNKIPKLINQPNLTQLRNQHLIREKKNIGNIAHYLTQSLASLVKAGQINITLTEHGMVIDLYDSLLFASGSAEIATKALVPIHEIAQQLRDLPNMILVEGHTDDIPISNLEFRSNWELSAMRASRLVGLISKEGIADKRLSATGYGASRPVADNADKLGRARNRHVTIVVGYKNLPL